jgi:DNA polymerase
LAWLAGQDDVVEQFRRGDDVYSVFATKIYGKPISKANPVERFVGKTCILGLGYGTGAMKLRHTLKTQPPGAEITEEEAKRYVSVYRTENSKIPDLWSECDRALNAMMKGVTHDFSLGQHKALWVTSEGVQLPNQLFIRYANLRLENEKMVYDSRKGPVNIWGGSMVENVVQALARIIVGEQMLKIREKYRPVLTVHDAAVIVVPEGEITQAVDFITKVMSTPPDWCLTLPVACEAKYGESYGEC